MQWTLKPRHKDILSLTISENELIGHNPPEIRYHYKVTDGDTYNLQIVNATNFTEGQYRCLANFTTEPDCVHYFDLLLKAPPSELRVINMTEKNTIIGKENENLTLACYTLGGIPRGKTIWNHGKKKLMTNKDNNETAFYSLTLNRNHNKQIYTCIAEHDMLRTPLNQSIKLDILYYPRLQFVLPNGPVLVGHSVNLSCSYYSNPLDAEISWTKNGQNIDSSYSIVTKIWKSERNLTEIKLIAEDTKGVTAIIFQNVTKTDEGAYTCNVTNTEGSASKTVYLVVQDIYSEKEITDELNNPSAILIYMVVCCCGVIIFVSSAQMYTCWKSGKLRRVFSRTRTFETVTPGETVHLDNFNTVQNVSDINTAHYMEIEF
ncbi:cell adhesion molecule 2-like [Mytilus californianus]|uniref:cell adhesion molecule 2-like n=1 Tax=Mytilus californianus TaxID=6549 RepID=UPI00224559C8|nr:cell adhesion molecule 2-like [Mytilus californianus]